jgi:uncharacterized protein YlxW (UPF0749 family)
VSRHLPENLLDRLIHEAQADDYGLAHNARRRTLGSITAAVLVFVVIGVVLAAAFWDRRSGVSAAQERRSALVERVERASVAGEQTQARVAELRGVVSQLQQLVAGGLGEGFTAQVEALQIASGFVGLQGPGAVVTMRDAQSPLPPGVDPDEARVLDIDMQAAVNGLWQAGARAIAINGIRLTSTTAIRTAGEAILVDYRPLEPPYRIVALGPTDLADRFRDSTTYGDLSDLGTEYGIQSEVAAEDALVVPASTANLPLRAEVDRSAAQ